ncbi:MAG: hypothetical protein LBV71_19165 [Prevotella sp.]|jgi:hypothetical protein|nr:hypothetical protein [Prevotella sp.]
MPFSFFPLIYNQSKVFPRQTHLLSVGAGDVPSFPFPETKQVFSAVNTPAVPYPQEKPVATLAYESQRNSILFSILSTH